MDESRSRRLVATGIALVWADAIAFLVLAAWWREVDIAVVGLVLCLMAVLARSTPVAGCLVIGLAVPGFFAGWFLAAFGAPVVVLVPLAAVPLVAGLLIFVGGYKE